MDTECQKCGSHYALRDGCEPTPFCDDCAHDEVERLTAKQAAEVLVIEDLIRACGCGINWMEQVSRAKISSTTRGTLSVDMAMSQAAIDRARKHLEKEPNDKLSEPGAKT